MPISRKIFFGFVFTILALSCALGMQQEDPLVEWYERFFFEEKETSADKDLALCDSKLQEAIEVNDPVQVVKMHMEIGLIHITRTQDYELALEHLTQALVLEDSLTMYREQVFTYLAVAKVFKEAGDYIKSAGFLDLAMEINQPLENNEAVLILLLNELGKVNAAQGRVDEAFENYNLVLKYQADLEQPKIEAEVLFNIGHLHQLKLEYDKALDYFKQSLNIRRALQDKKNESLTLNDIAELYRLMKNDEKALANHKVALQIRLAMKDEKGMAESYNNLGILYYDKQNVDTAVANFDLGLAAARESDTQNQIRKSFEYLSLCYKDKGDYKKALEYKDLLLAITEFIQNDKNSQKLLETQNRYVLNKKETQIERKESQIEKLESIRAQREKELQVQKRIKNVLFTMIALVLVIVLLVGYMYLIKRRSNKFLKVANEKVQQQNLELQELNATKDKFFSIISHDLKGPLNSLTSFSSLLINHTDSLSKDEIKMLAQDLDKSLKNLFSLLENLLEWSRSQTGNIEFKPEIFNLGELLEINRELLHAQAHNKKIKIIKTEAEAIQINAHKHSVNTVIRNLISNAIKFTPEGGEIKIGVQQHKGMVRVSIADNGVGMSKEVMGKLFRIDTKHSSRGTADEKGTGLGLILCKEFIEKNSGSIWVESEPNKGSVFYFTLQPASSVTSPVVRL